MSEKYLRIKDVQKKLGISRATIYRRIESKELPPPIKKGRTPSWPESAIDAAMSA